VIREGNALLQKYPNVPMLYSFLSSAYTAVGDQSKREATVKTCREQFPEYLFGKLALAQWYLSIGKAEDIPEIFDGKLDLQLLYPQRTSFHISEYIGFTGVLVSYYDTIGQHGLAREYYRMLTELVAPTHPVLRQLRGALFLSRLYRIFHRIAGLFRWRFDVQAHSARRNTRHRTS
jgi:hypothetical protein